MYLRPFQKTTLYGKPVSSALLIQIIMVLLACVGAAQAQRPNTPRDIVRAIGMKEMDQLLFLKRILPPKDDPVRRALVKQISEDFKELQGLNNKMMAEAWSRPELDYRYISDMVSQIRGKAARLKSTLALPQADSEKSKDAVDSYPDAEKFRVALLQLDRHIMRFATNPLFQKPDVIELDLAAQASRDLSVVVDVSSKLKKSAAKLSKGGKPSQ
jgi:hypothetical protein